MIAFWIAAFTRFLGDSLHDLWSHHSEKTPLQKFQEEKKVPLIIIAFWIAAATKFKLFNSRV